MLEINRIYNEDCIGLNGMCRIDDKSVDMILCDLPYGTTACKWDVIIPFDKLWEQYDRIVKDNGAIVLFGSQPFTSLLVASNIKLFRYSLIWEKEQATNFVFIKKQFGKIHEDISVFYKKQPVYNPQMITGMKPSNTGSRNSVTSHNLNGGTPKREGSTDRFPCSILKFNRDRQKLHPTQKPVALCEYLIRTYTDEGMLVLDNCIGSGTTAIAAMNTKRNYIGFEKDLDNYNICTNRLVYYKNNLQNY